MCQWPKKQKGTRHTNVLFAGISRHTVVHKQQRKQKKMQGTQVCYLLVLKSFQIQPSVSPKLLSHFFPNLYIFALHIATLLHISKIEGDHFRISRDIFFLKIAQLSSHFSSLHNSTNIAI